MKFTTRTRSYGDQCDENERAREPDVEVRMDLVDLLHVHRGRLLLVDAEPQVRRDRDAVLAAHRCEEEDGDGMAGLDGERAGPSLRRVSEIWDLGGRPPTAFRARASSSSSSSSSREITRGRRREAREAATHR
jgi:hypothetical protein